MGLHQTKKFSTETKQNKTLAKQIDSLTLYLERLEKEEQTNKQKKKNPKSAEGRRS